MSAALPALAQSNVVAPPPPPREGTIGPEQLRDFSLGGNRESPADPPAELPAADRSPATETATLPRAAPPERPASSAASRPGSGPTAAAASASVALPPPAPAQDEPGFDFGPATPAPPPNARVPDPTPFVPAPVPENGSGGLPGYLPWLAALAFAGAAGWWFLRRRSAQQVDPGRLAFAGAAAQSGAAAAPSPETPLPSAPRPVPAAPTPAPVPAPAPSPGGGIVSTRLRAWLDCELGIRAAVLTDTELQLHLDLLLINSGSVPARDIAIEALVLNAGPTQDQELATFFARPDGEAKAADLLQPLAQLPLQPTVRMARTAFREYAAGGGQVLVPLIAFNVGYRAGSMAGRSSAAFIVGPPAKGSDKLAPLRTDTGPRTWTEVTLRPLDGRIRR
ncbi:MAG TPA: hypothetical protein VM913_07720 [Sphingomicrobium sp.]|nr:hypothetical protein [Sphingomicrobium sp.]